MSDLRDVLQERLQHDLGSEAKRFTITRVGRDRGACRITATLDVDKVVATIHGVGASADLAYVDLVGKALERVDELADLLDRAQEACWVCGQRSARMAMDPELIGDTIWWLCGRCRQRRQNADRLGLIWPTDFDAWWRHWSALRAIAGGSHDELAGILARAEQLHDTDPTVVNRQAAVLRVTGAP